MATPRRWQLDALTTWQENYRGTVSVVTGGGKTVFAYMCMLAFRKLYPDCRFIILVPTLALLDQWYVSLQEDLHVSPEDISCFSSQEHSKEANLINIAVLNTARDLAPALSAQYITFLIVDECHRAGSPENARALEGEHQATLGLSATPKRDYDAGFEEHVAPALGDIIYEYDYTAARNDGVITQFNLVNIRIDLLGHEQEQYNKLTKAAARELGKIQENTSPFDSPKLKHILQRRAAISASATMRIPVAARLADMHRGERTLVFHEQIKKADALLRILLAKGHSAAAYHTGLGPYLRRDNLRLYRSGVFEVLITCRALDEGLNVPETSVAIIASSTASTRQRIQRLGRVLRPSPTKTSATIYTIFATPQEERRLRTEAENLSNVSSIRWAHGGI